MINKKTALAALFSTLWIMQGVQAQHSVSLLIYPQYNSYSSATLFDVPEQVIEKPQASSRQILELTGAHSNKWVNISYLLSLRHQISSHRTVETELASNELYLNKSLNDWDITLGRRISSWGVGYGFRPLDVIQQFDQQTTSQQSPLGKNILALEYFSPMSSWSLVWVNSELSKVDTNTKSNDAIESLVMQYSSSRDSYDLHGLLRYNQQNKLQLGLGGVKITTDEIAVHGSLLWSQKYRQLQHQLAGQSSILLAEQFPYDSIEYRQGMQALIGLNWSSLSKHSVIAEYWYNEWAYSQQQWAQIFELAVLQQNILNNTSIPQSAVHRNIAWTAAATQTQAASQALAQHNLMLQWTYDADHWKPTVNLLLNPADNSNMLTLSVTRSTHLFKFTAGIRTFNGANDSVYGGLIVDRIMFMTLVGEY